MERIVLVTGGAGFIGSHIVDALVQRGDRVRVFDNLSTGSLENLRDGIQDIDFIEADIGNADALAKGLKDVELVFHQAALASVPLSVERPIEVNRACVTGTLNVLEQARKHKVQRVVYAASSSCYGDQPFSANRETDPLCPLSPYAAAKLAGEHYCKAYFETHGLETVVLRYFNVFGPRQDPNSHYSAVIPLFITRLLSGQPPVVYGDGQQSRDFTFISNVVDGNLLAADSDRAPGRTFNLAYGRATTLLQLLDSLGKLLQVDIAPDHQAPRSGDIRDSLADISQAVSVLGYQPNVSFEEGLRRSIEYYQSIIKPVTS